ncbi:MAG: inositol monophosphatase [Actinomycetes bacterium]
MDERYDFGLSLIAEAGALALSFFHDLESLDVTEKGPQDLVSRADRETEALIKSAIAERFPGDAFVGEETGVTSGSTGGTWVVDPIDGTTPFLLGMTSWCVSIAYVSDNDTSFGLIFAPATGDLYAARRGAGATLNGRPIHVSDATTLAAGSTGIGASSKTTLDEIIFMLSGLHTAGGMFYRVGSGALTLCYVAAGQLVGYVEPLINSWDCLAALCIIREAGGRTSPFLEEFGVAGSRPLVAGTPGAYEALEALLP